LVKEIASTLGAQIAFPMLKMVYFVMPGAAEAASQNVKAPAGLGFTSLQGFCALSRGFIPVRVR